MLCRSVPGKIRQFLISRCRAPSSDDPTTVMVIASTCGRQRRCHIYTLVTVLISAAAVPDPGSLLSAKGRQTIAARAPDMLRTRQQPLPLLQATLPRRMAHRALAVLAAAAKVVAALARPKPEARTKLSLHQNFTLLPRSLFDSVFCSHMATMVSSSRAVTAWFVD